MCFRDTLENAMLEAKRLAQVNRKDFAVVQDGQKFVVAPYNKIRHMFPSLPWWDAAYVW